MFTDRTGSFDITPPGPLQGGVFRIRHMPTKDEYLVDWAEVGTYHMVTQWLKAHRGALDPEVGLLMHNLFPRIAGILQELEMAELRYAMLESGKVSTFDFEEQVTRSPMPGLHATTVAKTNNPLPWRQP